MEIKHAIFSNDTRSCYQQIRQTLVDASKIEDDSPKFVGNKFIKWFGGT